MREGKEDMEVGTSYHVQRSQNGLHNPHLRRVMLVKRESRDEILKSYRDKDKDDICGTASLSSVEQEPTRSC